MSHEMERFLFKNHYPTSIYNEIQISISKLIRRLFGKTLLSEMVDTMLNNNMKCIE